MQKDIRATFGGLFGAEQLKSLSELRLPFRLVFDHFNPNPYIKQGGYERVCQKSLHVTNNGSLKLSCIPSPSSNANAEDLYLLETSDENFLNFPKPVRCRPFWNFSGKSRARELQILTSTYSFLCNPKPSCIFSILPQPDGRILMQWNRKFIQASIIKDSKEIEIKLTTTDDPFEASKFLLEPVGDESAHLIWCALFGGSIGLKKIGQLLNRRLPFFLSAVQENYRFYVNVQKIIESPMYNDNIKSPMYDDHEGDDPYQADTNTFTLLEGNAVDGTNCLLHSSSGQYLCVSHYKLRDRDFVNLATSPLDFDAVKGTPQQKFLFDFVPRSPDTFAIRSHYNGKFVDATKCWIVPGIDGTYFIGKWIGRILTKYIMVCATQRCFLSTQLSKQQRSLSSRHHQWLHRLNIKNIQRKKRFA